MEKIKIIYNKIKNKVKYWCYVGLNLVKYIKSGRKRRALLINTPAHGNIGDQAIVLAEIQLLEENGIDIYELTAEKIDNQEKKFAAFVPKNQTILVQGGGFLGSLWINEEERFRRILQVFKKQKIIVFPQTITFDVETKRGQEYLKESQLIYSAHPDLTIFVREKKSYEFMKKYFSTVKCRLVPDIVTILQIDIEKEERKGILLCLRSDHEKSISQLDSESIKQILQDKFIGESIKYTDTVVKYNISYKEREREVNKKLRQFAKSKLIITDRLHGMIFAAITGTPCVALSNINGKVQGVYEWIKDNKYIFFAKNVKEVREILDSVNWEMQYKFNHNQIMEKFKLLNEEMEKLVDEK